MPRRVRTPEETEISNDGERLIPGVSLGVAEVVRHRSSYLFFRRVIELDLALSDQPPERLTIADLGCGVGHGCVTLSEIPGAQVTGFDNSQLALGYAERHYARPNVHYEVADLANLIPRLGTYDYVVSRGALEHVDDGIELARSIAVRNRLIIDVPYAEEPDANDHHRLHDLREEAFAGFRRCELCFQELWGTIHDSAGKPGRPNMIICISTQGDLPPAADLLAFPVPAWHPERASDRIRLIIERGTVYGGRTKRRALRAVRRRTRD